MNYHILFDRYYELVEVLGGLAFHRSRQAQLAGLRYMLRHLLEVVEDTKTVIYNLEKGEQNGECCEGTKE